MFPKLLKNAKLEDVEKENPKLIEEMKNFFNQSKDSDIATLQVTHEQKVTELETQCSQLSSNMNILIAGINAKQGDLALTLISEGKSEADALAEIQKQKQSLENFQQSAPDAAGNGSSSDSQEIDTQTKAVEYCLNTTPGTTRGQAIRLARRQFPHLFVSSTLLNHTEKR